MKRIAKTLIPRLPKEAREKLKSGGTHKNKKAYKRNAKHRGRDSPRPHFIYLGETSIYNLLNMQYNEIPTEEPAALGVEQDSTESEDNNTVLTADSVQATAARITSESNDEMQRLTQLQELFAEHFGSRFEKIEIFSKDLPGNISVAVRETSADALKVEITHAGESKHFFVYQNGKVEGGIPKSWEFSKADLLETIISAVDTYGDNFFRDDTPEELVAEDIGLEPFLLDGEVVPPDHTGELPPRTGEGTIEMRPEDPRRLDFYKRLPGVLCTFVGTINTRGKAFGSQGIPYRVYVFPQHIILDCSEVGNAIFVRELDQPLNVDMNNLQLPLGERISDEERQRFEEQIWRPNFSEKTKGDLRQLGFNRIYHPQQERVDDTYFSAYAAKLAKHIDFSTYSAHAEQHSTA